MIRHDIPWTTGPMVGAANTALALAADNERLRGALAAILRAGDRAARGGKLVTVHDHAVVFIGADEWQAMRRSMVQAGRVMAGERGQVN